MLIELGELLIQYVKSEDMVADLLTKPVVGYTFAHLLTHLLGYYWKKEIYHGA